VDLYVALESKFRGGRRSTSRSSIATDDDSFLCLPEYPTSQNVGCLIERLLRQKVDFPQLRRIRLRHFSDSNLAARLDEVAMCEDYPATTVSTEFGWKTEF
jgi:hypothetical protein